MIGDVKSARTKGTVVMLERRVSPHSVPRPGRLLGASEGCSASSMLLRACGRAPAAADESIAAEGGGEFVATPGDAGDGPGVDAAVVVGNPRRVLLCDEGNRRVLLVDLQNPSSAVWSTQTWLSTPQNTNWNQNFDSIVASEKPMIGKAVIGSP